MCSCPGGAESGKSRTRRSVVGLQPLLWLSRKDPSVLLSIFKQRKGTEPAEPRCVGDTVSQTFQGPLDPSGFSILLVSIILSCMPDTTIKPHPPRCMRAAHPCRITRRHGWANVFIIYLFSGPHMLQQNAELPLWELV